MRVERAKSSVPKLLETTYKYKKHFATLQHILQLVKHEKKGPTWMGDDHAYRADMSRIECYEIQIPHDKHHKCPHW